MPAEPIHKVLGISPALIEIIDVGAMEEDGDRYAGLVDHGLARVTGFEPDEEQYWRLYATKTGPYRFLPYYIGSGEPASFYRTRYQGCSSLYRPDPAVIDLFTSIGTRTGDNFCVLETRQVETMRLDDVPDLPPPDLLKIDVQGAELDVLRGGTRTLASACVLELEVEFIPLYRDQPLFGDIQVFLREHGFLLHKFIDVAGRPFRPCALRGNDCVAMSQLLWADAIFVRDFTKLAHWSDEQLLKGAAIMHEMYRSCDLVHYLLKEHDRRHATGVTPKYVNYLLSLSDIPRLYLNEKARR